jgi:hypothetical protein
LLDRKIINNEMGYQEIVWELSPEKTRKGHNIKKNKKN